MARGKFVRLRPRRRKRRASLGRYSNLVSVALLSTAQALRVAFNIEDIVAEVGTISGRGMEGRTGMIGRSGSILRGRVSHVRDGDTVVVAGTPVRIANLYCAERGTALRRAGVHPDERHRAIGAVHLRLSRLR